MAACFIALTSTASAQEPQTAPAALAQLFDCREMNEDSDRLLCLDAAAAELHRAHTTGALISVDQERAAQIEQEAFGFSLPSLPALLRGDTAADDVSNTRIVIAALRRRLDRRTVFTATNGQVWEQTDTADTSQIHVGHDAEIRRAALGSYVLHVDGTARAVRVRRVE